MTEDLDPRLRRVLHDQNQTERNRGDESGLQPKYRTGQRPMLRERTGGLWPKTHLDADEQSEQESSRHLCKVLDGSDAPVKQNLMRDLDDDTPHDEKDDGRLKGESTGDHQP